MSQLKGDFNLIGVTNISDAQYLLNWIAAGGNTTKLNMNLDYNGTDYIIDDQRVLLDTNGDGIINISDAQYLLNWIAAGGNSTKIGEYLPYGGSQYIIDYVTSQTNWNGLTKEIPNSKYRFFVEFYNIPVSADGATANIKNNDGMVVIDTGAIGDNMSAKSTDQSGYVTEYVGASGEPLNTDASDPHHDVALEANTFYHKSVAVPMGGETITLKELILYIFFTGHAYNIPLSNTGVLATLDLTGLTSPTISNNDTVIVDNLTNRMYVLSNDASTVVDVSSKLVDGSLFS